MRLDAEEGSDFIALITDLLEDKFSTGPPEAELHFDQDPVQDAVMPGVGRWPDFNALELGPSLDQALPHLPLRSRGRKLPDPCEWAGLPFGG